MPNNSTMTSTDILFKKRDKDNLNKEEIFYNTNMEKILEKQCELMASIVLSLKQRK